MCELSLNSYFCNNKKCSRLALLKFKFLIFFTLLTGPEKVMTCLGASWQLGLAMGCLGLVLEAWTGPQVL